MKSNVSSILLFNALLITSHASFAHCDTKDGPVVAAATKAIKHNNINYALIWVKPAYEREIKKAVDNKNYRLAIRLWYLLTLKESADRNIIDYRHEKTDSDYVNSLYGSSYYHNFFRLTRNFEYTWYGQFSISPETYNLLQADFSKFKNSLQS